MAWIELVADAQIDKIVEDSKLRPQVIFKHSTSCSTSAVAKSRLERQQFPDHIDFYYLDLLRFRPLSDAVSSTFAVYHESPQVLLIKNGQCVYDESHLGISMNEIVEQNSLS